MTYRADDRYLRCKDRSGNAFIVKGCKIFRRTSASAYDQGIDPETILAKFISECDIVNDAGRCACSLDLSRKYEYVGQIIF